MDWMVNNMKNFMNNFIKENPVLVLYLGICSVLALSVNLDSAIGIGLSVTIVLMISNLIISAIRKLIPDEAKLIVYIMIVSSVVTIVEMLLRAYASELALSLGIFIPLMVCNSIIIRDELYATKNSIISSVFNGIKTGLSYTFVIMLIALFRQLLATGGLSMSNPFNPKQIFFDFVIIPKDFTIELFNSSAGAFIMFALFAALFAYLKDVLGKKGVNN